MFYVTANFRRNRRDAARRRRDREIVPGAARGRDAYFSAAVHFTGASVSVHSDRRLESTTPRVRAVAKYFPVTSAL